MTMVKHPKIEVDKELVEYAENIFEKIGVKNLFSVEALKEFGADNLIIGKKWNPSNKNDIVKTDKVIKFKLKKTIFNIAKAYLKIQDTVKEKGEYSIIFVCSKMPALAKFVKKEAEANNQMYVIKRWLGGTLTNLKTLRQSIGRLSKINELHSSGKIKEYSRNDQIIMKREADKLESFISGVKNIKDNTKLLVIVDPVKEHVALDEAKKLGLNVITLSNSDFSTNKAKFSENNINIQCNTYSKDTVWLILSVMFDALNAANNNPLLVVGKKEVTPSFSK